MGYQIFERKKTRTSTPSVTINPESGRITLNAATAQLFQKEAVELVLLMWDPDQLRIAIRPITKVDDKRAYKVSYGKRSNGGSFAARSFLEHIHWKKESGNCTVPVQWNDEHRMLEFEVDADWIEGGAQLKLVAGRKDK